MPFSDHKDHHVLPVGNVAMKIICICYSEDFSCQVQCVWLKSEKKSRCHKNHTVKRHHALAFGTVAMKLAAYVIQKTSCLVQCAGAMTMVQKHTLNTVPLHMQVA
jgi:hypothetical protein